MSAEKPTCYCGLDLFWDVDKFLCPARFDGNHSEEQRQEHLAKILQKHTHAQTSGSIGGKRRAENLSPEQRTEIAKKAASIRWKDKKQLRQP